MGSWKKTKQNTPPQNLFSSEKHTRMNKNRSISGAQFVCPPQEAPEEPFDYSKLAYPIPDNNTFVECMQGLLKVMHQGFDQDPNLKGVLLPPEPLPPSQKTRKRRRARTLKLGDEEEAIIKEEEREAFERVLQSQLADPSAIGPLPECRGTKYEFKPHHQCPPSQHLMMILLQYQSFKSYPYYTDDENVQQEQINLQKQRRHELMKQKRAIRRERRKEMKMKRGLDEVDIFDQSTSKRTKYDHHNQELKTEQFSDNDDDYSNRSWEEQHQQHYTSAVEHLADGVADLTQFDYGNMGNSTLDLFLSPTTSLVSSSLKS